MQLIRKEGKTEGQGAARDGMTRELKGRQTDTVGRFVAGCYSTGQSAKSLLNESLSPPADTVQ